MRRTAYLCAVGLAANAILSGGAGADPVAPAGRTEMGLRLEGSANGQDFPLLLIHVTRHGEEAGRIRVRFPEGIDAWRAGDRQHLKFYQDVRSPAWPAKLETEPMGLPVEWTGDDTALRYVMRLDNGMALTAEARVEGASVRMAYRLANETDVDLAALKIWSCVQLAQSPPLADLLMERTGVVVEGGFRLFRELVPGFEPYAREDAVRQRFTAYPPGQIPGGPNPRISPHPGFPDDRDQDIYFWHSLQPIEAAAIATLSVDGQWAAAVVAHEAPSVWSNPGISCLHADPSGVACTPGATALVTKTLHFIEGGRDVVAERLRKLARLR